MASKKELADAVGLIGDEGSVSDRALAIHVLLLGLPPEKGYQICAYAQQKMFEKLTKS